MLTIYEHHAYHICYSVNQVTTGFELDFILRCKFTGRPAKITKKPKYDHDDQNSLFSGSKNVKHAPGKTETAKALAQILNKKLLRFDMSEYRNCEKFLHNLTLCLDKQSSGIILLDEIEKGNMDIFDYFLQILSEATITHNQKVYNLSGYYIIMTSNIGSKNIIGQDNFAIARRIVERLVKSHFRPEFLGRIRRDCQICFKPLEYDVMKQVVKQKVETEIARLQEKGYSLEYDKSILTFLMNVGVNPEFGARPVVQAIQKYIALAIIDADMDSGVLTINSNQLILA